MDRVGNLFSFSGTDVYEETDSIFSYSVPFLRTFVIKKKDITEYVKGLNEERFSQLELEKVILSDYAIEFISNSFKTSDNQHYGETREIIENILSDYYFAGAKYYTEVVNLTIIICDNIAELNKTVLELNLKSFSTGIYYGTHVPSRMAEGFINELYKRYTSFDVKNPVAILSPDASNEEYGYQGPEEIGKFIAFWYSVGFLNILQTSIVSISGSLEYLTWTIDDIFSDYENNLCFKQRYLFSQSQDVSKKLRQIHEKVTLLRKFSDSVAYARLSETYGEILPAIVSDSLGAIEEHEALLVVPKGEIMRDINKSMIDLSKTLNELFQELNSKKNEWIKIHSDNIMNNKFMITVIMSVLTLFLTIVTFLLTDFIGN